MDYLHQVPSPCFVLEEALLEANLQKIHAVQEQAGVEIILALKGFSMWSTFPMIQQYLSGATASSLNEALLCVDKMGKKAHTYAPAYRKETFEQIVRCSSHLTFNSLSQYQHFYDQAKRIDPNIEIGLRINPGYSTVETDLYNPCVPGSRLGVPANQLEDGLPMGITGIHFHNLCESMSTDLEKTLQSVEKLFGHLLPQVQWVNMGGGHLMTHQNYDRSHLIELLKAFKSKHQVEIILEPGSAIAWQTGVLVATILDVFDHEGVKTVMLDTSFTAHMPDTLEMPYRPKVRFTSDPTSSGEGYRLGGMSCLAGDYLSEYVFESEPKVGDRIILEDMMHYTMVKTNMFNGVDHPAIAIWRKDHTLDVIRTFTYGDFRDRLS